MVVDSFQAVVRVASAAEPAQLDLQSFMQRLAVHLTIWQATTFLIGEYLDDGLEHYPLLHRGRWDFRAAPETVHRNSVVRKLQVLKQRGQAPMPGLHTFRISQAGLQVFPRCEYRRDGGRPRAAAWPGRHRRRGLDDLLGGGIPIGDAVLVSGPSGTGKSVLAAQFIAAGVRAGRAGRDRRVRGTSHGIHAARPTPGHRPGGAGAPGRPEGHLHPAAGPVAGRDAA